jgi:hypothetical protein
MLCQSETQSIARLAGGREFKSLLAHFQRLLQKAPLFAAVGEQCSSNVNKVIKNLIALITAYTSKTLGVFYSYPTTEIQKFSRNFLWIIDKYIYRPREIYYGDINGSKEKKSSSKGTKIKINFSFIFF